MANLSFRAAHIKPVAILYSVLIIFILLTSSARGRLSKRFSCGFCSIYNMMQDSKKSAEINEQIVDVINSSSSLNKRL